MGRFGNKKRKRSAGKAEAVWEERGAEQGGKKNGGGDFTEQFRNEAFEAFYKAQNIVPEGEWEEFISTLSKSLPLTFRLSTVSNGHKKLLDDLSNMCYGDQKEQFVVEGKVSRVSWF